LNDAPDWFAYTTTVTSRDDVIASGHAGLCRRRRLRVAWRATVGGDGRVSGDDERSGLGDVDDDVTGSRDDELDDVTTARRRRLWRAMAESRGSGRTTLVVRRGSPGGAAAASSRGVGARSNESSVRCSWIARRRWTASSSSLTVLPPSAATTNRATLTPFSVTR